MLWCELLWTFLLKEKYAYTAQQTKIVKLRLGATFTLILIQATLLYKSKLRTFYHVVFTFINKQQA